MHIQPFAINSTHRIFYIYLFAFICNSVYIYSFKHTHILLTIVLSSCLKATKIVLNVPLKAKESQQKKERRSHSETKTNQSQKNFTNRKLSATTLDAPPG